MSEIDKKPSFFRFDGMRLRNRLYINILDFSILLLIVHFINRVATPSQFNENANYMLGIILSPLLIYYELGEYKLKIQGNNMHYRVNTKAFLIFTLIFVVLFSVCFLFLLDMPDWSIWHDFSNQLVNFWIGLLPIAYLITNLVILFWLIHYEKQHGPVYEVNDYYAEKSPTIPVP